MDPVALPNAVELRDVGELAESADRMVGAIGIEPMTSAMSMCESPALRSG